MSADLVAFLQARLDEDERAAQACSPWPWAPNAEGDEVLSTRTADDSGLRDNDLAVAAGHALSSMQLRANVAHIARHDPARVLAEVAAKRRLVELHGPVDDDPGGPPYCVECERYDGTGKLCPTICVLALPYAEHPDYRQEWKP